MKKPNFLKIWTPYQLRRVIVLNYSKPKAEGDKLDAWEGHNALFGAWENPTFPEVAPYSVKSQT